MISFTIDGRAAQGEAGEMVLAVSKRLGFDIPTHCHHDGLEPVGSCRLCLVEITHASWKGWKGLVTACLYPIEEGLVVTTDNEEIRQVRTVLSDLLLARCPDAAEVQALAKRYGVGRTSYRERPERTLCTLCMLCVRACESIGASAIGTMGRGAARMVGTPCDLAPEACVGCGTCAEVCPTGFIACKEDEAGRHIWDRDFTFVRCEGGGAPVLTVEHAALAAKKSGLDPSYFTRCDACKRNAAAKVYSQLTRVAS